MDAFAYLVLGSVMMLVLGYLKERYFGFTGQSISAGQAPFGRQT